MSKGAAQNNEGSIAERVKTLRYAGHNTLKQLLIHVSIHGLNEMFDGHRLLFHSKIKRTQEGVEKFGYSLRYTIIALLGLFSTDEENLPAHLTIHAALECIVKKIKDITTIGDLGLLLWLLSFASKEQLQQILSKVNIENFLRRSRDARAGRTMELSWFLTGLAHIKLSGIKVPSSLADLASRTYKMLINNYGGEGIFGHLKFNSYVGMLRGRIGSFADQVYPIYALTKYAQACGRQEPLQVALACARKIVQHQGPFGQWWWHYDSLTGDVVSKYPVYSVHQDAMAPMALQAIARATGYDLTAPVERGLDWLRDNNELHCDLIDVSRNAIWRCISSGHYHRYSEDLRRIINMPFYIFNNKLKITFECRSYHLGWVLYTLQSL